MKECQYVEHFLCTRCLLLPLLILKILLGKCQSEVLMVVETVDKITWLKLQILYNESAAKSRSDTKVSSLSVRQIYLIYSSFLFL